MTSERPRTSCRRGVLSPPARAGPPGHGRLRHGDRGTGATLLLLAFAPGRRGPLPAGASQEEIETTFDAWAILADEPADTSGMPRPLRHSAPPVVPPRTQAQHTSHLTALTTRTSHRSPGTGIKSARAPITRICTAIVITVYKLRTAPNEHLFVRPSSRKCWMRCLSGGQIRVI